MAVSRIRGVYILLQNRILVELDAVLSESHAAEVEVTDHPVEVGANVSDHARLKPEQVTIDGIISDTPVNRGGPTRTVNASGDVSFVSSSVEDVPSGVAGRAEDAYAKLRQLKDARQLVTVSTELRTYKNMMLTSLNVPRDGKTGDALHFTATFKEVRLAELRVAQVRITVPRAAKKKTDVGSQGTPQATDEDEQAGALWKLGHKTETGKKVVNAIRPPSTGIVDRSFSVFRPLGAK